MLFELLHGADMGEVITVIKMGGVLVGDQLVVKLASGGP